MKDSVRQNLIDAGCDEELICKFDECIADKKKCEKLLADHRRRLLEEVHTGEARIECLDYLVFKMKKDGLE